MIGAAQKGPGGLQSSPLCHCPVPPSPTLIRQFTRPGRREGSLGARSRTEEHLGDGGTSRQGPAGGAGPREPTTGVWRLASRVSPSLSIRIIMQADARPHGKLSMTQACSLCCWVRRLQPARACGGPPQGAASTLSALPIPNTTPSAIQPPSTCAWVRGANALQQAPRAVQRAPAAPQGGTRSCRRPPSRSQARTSKPAHHAQPAAADVGPAQVGPQESEEAQPHCEPGGGGRGGRSGGSHPTAQQPVRRPRQTNTGLVRPRPGAALQALTRGCCRNGAEPHRGVWNPRGGQQRDGGADCSTQGAGRRA